MKVSADSISFSVTVEFPNCDVDAVFSEIAGGIAQEDTTINNEYTPIYNSIETFWDAVYADDTLKEIGVQLQETYGLMQGVTHGLFSMDIDTINPKVLIKATVDRVKEIAMDTVRYYPMGSTIKASRVAIVGR